MGDDRREPLRVLLFAASLRVDSINARLAQLAATVIERLGASVVNAHVLEQAPYAERPGRDTTNATDEIFSTGGEPALLDVAPDGDSYRAAICLVLPAVEEVP